MKKIVLSLLVIVAFVITSCEKDVPQDNQGETFDKQNLTRAYGGDFIYGDGWIGWLDPELVGDDNIDEDQIYRGPAKKKGEIKQNADGSTYIICYGSGTKCGGLYIVSTHGVEWIGYLSLIHISEPTRPY